jgi:DtxR family Mn-dependent transcriptional regulator
MARIGLVEFHGGQVAFTPRGEERARSVIRRHRLAERLFMDVLAIRDEGSIEKNACTFEHILSPEVTDRICTFLGHPRTCPHGSPIPEGGCCLDAQAAETGRRSSARPALFEVGREGPNRRVDKS